MAQLPQTIDPTLEAADRALECAQERKMRTYLGMSAIGDMCPRKLWYGFRHVREPSFDAATLKRFADGHATEAVVIARLKAVNELELHDTDERGDQWGFRDLGGHFAGHMDGVVLGLLQAPKTWHVLEVKATAPKKLEELKKAKRDFGEKLALRQWNPVYYAQAILYMDYAGLDRHYLVCSTAGGRDWISVRTNADPAEALRLKQLGERLIFSDEPPARIGGPDFYYCGWCEYSDVCHHGAQARRTCRTCLHITPLRQGGWRCERYGHEDEKALELGCTGDHRFLPGLIAAEQVDVRDGNPVYRCKDGSEWVDRGPQ